MVMQSDSGSPRFGPPIADIWTPPRLEAVDIMRVRYMPPRVDVRLGKLTETEEGVEIQVRTSGPVPARALAAALYVGSVEIIESERFGPADYRFFPLDEDVLVPGAPIALGWSGMGPPREEAVGFRYHPPKGKAVTRRRPRPGRRWSLAALLHWMLRLVQAWRCRLRG